MIAVRAAAAAEAKKRVVDAFRIRGATAPSARFHCQSWES
jgi:hypothetical protein